MRLIDADRARETATIDLIVHHLDRQPTVDAVEVVRCKNCKHYDEWSDGRAMNHCSKHDRLAYDDDFCSCGERKTGTQPQKEATK